MADMSKSAESTSDASAFPILTDSQMEEYERNIIVMVGLSMVQLLLKAKFDQKAMAVDLDALVQILAANIALRNEIAETEELSK